LPGLWASTGEQFGNGNGANGGVPAIETGAANGLIAVNTVISNVTNVNFGIESTPYANDKTYQLHPDSLNNKLTGNLTYPHFVKLNAASGSADVDVNTSFPDMPGVISGNDLEEGNYKGVTGNLMDTTVFITLPDPNYALLAYKTGGTDVLLVANPTIADPSFVFWNPQFSRYQIATLNPQNLLLYVKLVYQTSMSFQYAYKDSARLLGRIGTYTINSTPLPLAISGFDCKSVKNNIRLKWILYDAMDVASVQILRSTNGVNFVQIGLMNDIDRTAAYKDYSYIDFNPSEGNNFYKIAVVTNNGSKIHSEICNHNVNVQISGVTLNVLPNPTWRNTSLVVVAADVHELKIELLSSIGQTINTQYINARSGSTLIPMETEGLNPGVYNIRVSWDSNVRVLRFVKL